MTDLFRIVIAELPRFPELAQAQFSQGKMPYFESVRRYLSAEHTAGTARIDDLELATTQFLGMISNYIFWPSLLVPGWQVTAERVTQVVDEAAQTFAARYGMPGTPPSTDGWRTHGDAERLTGLQDRERQRIDLPGRQDGRTLCRTMVVGARGRPL
ncbi:hypothetical protein Asp14428_48580 [Actinoplanes sp. NBRC 14428]|nr:hypothetical protein Asp14428_48580 [Actinoplanes sp. NBRC 14428]